jgi:hypothetical protein
MNFEEDIVLAKVSTIRKAVATIRSLDSELPGAEKEWMRLDLTVLNLQRVVEAAIGFRNIAVHDYTRLDPRIVRGIAVDHLGDLEEFANEVLRKTTASG